MLTAFLSASILNAICASLTVMLFRFYFIHYCQFQILILLVIKICNCIFKTSTYDISTIVIDILRFTNYILRNCSFNNILCISYFVINPSKEISFWIFLNNIKQATFN